MKKILFSLLLMAGVTFSASAQKGIDVNAIIEQTAQTVTEAKNYSATQKEQIITILKERLTEESALKKNKLVGEERKAEMLKISNITKDKLDSQVAQGDGEYIQRTFLKNRTAASKGPKKVAPNAKKKAPNAKKKATNAANAKKKTPAKKKAPANKKGKGKKKAAKKVDAE